MRNVSYQTKRRIVKLRRLSRWWPWVASAAVHVGVLAILYTVVLVSYNTKAEKPEIVPEARLGRVIPGLPLFQQIKTDVDLPQETNFEKTLKAQLTPQDSTLTTAVAKPSGPGGTGHSGPKQPFNPIGIMTSSSGDGILAGPAPRSQNPTAIPGADLARLQPTAPVTRFFNTVGNAYNIIYIVDRSASMIDSIEPLKRELRRSINDLQPMQKFHIIFFSSGKPLEGPAGEMTWATDRNKAKYGEFIDSVKAEGQTDPQWAFQRALQMDPDLVYLLTDGIFNEKIGDKIIEWARLHKVKINTIAYVWESGGTLLRRIAEQTGGIYRFVSEEQLQ